MVDSKPLQSMWKEWPLAIILIAPFIALAIVWPSLPARVPTHFDLRGTANHYGGPASLLILPGINILVALLLYYIPRLDPKQKNIRASMPAYRWIRFSIAAFFTYVFFLMVASARNARVDVEQFIAFGLLVLFLIIGLALPRIRQSYFIGIRLPWTLESEENWTQTHQFAGKLLPVVSLAGIVLAILFPEISILIAIGILVAFAIWTVVYSYRLFRLQNSSKT